MDHLDGTQPHHRRCITGEQKPGMHLSASPSYGMTWMLLILIITLLVGSMPVRSASAQAQTVLMTPPAVRDTIWIANAVDRLEGARRGEVVALALVLQRMYLDKPGLAPATAVSGIRSLQATYSASGRGSTSYGVTADERVLSVFAVLTGSSMTSSPYGAAIVAAATRAFSITLGLPLTSFRAGLDRIGGSTELHHTSVPLDSADRVVLRDSINLARQNPSFGAAFDQLWSAELQASIYAGTTAIIQSNPRIQALSSITRMIDSTGAIKTTLDNVKLQVGDQFTNVNATTNSALALVVSLDQMQSSLTAYAADEATRTQVQANTATIARDLAEQLKKARIALRILTDLVGLVDNVLGKQIKTVGDAAIEVADSINEYAKAVAGLGTIQALTSFSTMVLAGNMIGAVMALMPLFEESKPSPQQMILDQIGKLRQQVATLSTQLHARFDRIDRSLNVIYQTLNDRFNKLDLELGRISGDLHEIQSSLIELQRSMNRFERNMYDILFDGFRQQLKSDINGGIGYLERTGATMSFQPEFVDYENSFHSWATIHAFDSTATGGSSRSYADDQVVDELNRYPLDTNINYLAQFISQRWGLPSFVSSRVPNPRDWAMSGRAYAELAMDWPQHAFQISPSRLTAIRSVGQSLQSTLRQISTVQTSSGPRGNTALFSRLITNYQDKATAVDQAIQGLEVAAREDVRRAVPSDPNDDRHGVIDFWAGASQPLHPSDLPLLPALPGCGGGQALATPSNILSLLLPQPFLVARYLGLGAIHVCYSADWTETREEVIRKNAEVIATNSYSKLQVNVTATYNGTSVRAVRVQLPETNDGGCSGPELSDCWQKDPYDETAFNWTERENIKGDIEAGLPLSHDNSGLLDTVTGDVKSKLQQEQQGLYQRVLNGLAAGPLATMAKELTGAKALIDAFIALGMPRALETNEYFRSFLAGNQRLLDQDGEQRLSTLYAGAKASPPVTNIRLVITHLMRERSSLLGGVISNYLAGVDAGTHRESHRLIDTSLDRLMLAHTLVRTPLARIAPATLTLGSVMVSASKARTVTLSNEGAGAPLQISSIALSGTNAGDFAVSHSCAASLPPMARCTITVTLRPTATGTRSALLTVVDNALGSPHSITLTGIGWVPASPGNYVANAGFELDANGDTRPDSWTANPNVMRSTKARSGSFSMQHASSADASFAIASTGMMGLVPGTPYAFSGWVNIPTPTTSDSTGFTFQLEVQWRNGDNQLVGTTPLRTYTSHTAGAWSPVATTVVAPTGTASAAIRMVVSSLRQTIYVDDLFFGNLLPNPGFELDLNGDGHVDSWTASSRVTRSSAARRAGSFAMRHLATDNTSYTLAQSAITAAPGTTYAFSTYVMIPTTSDTFSFGLDIQWLDANNAVVGTTPIKTYSAHTSGAWSLVSANLRAPTGSTRARLRMVVTSLNATIYVDNMVLRP